MFAYTYHLMSPVGGDQAVRVSIPPGESAGQIARRLHRARLIRSPLAFVAFARIWGESSNMKAGDYRISPKLGVIEIIDKLVAGDAETRWITIPEGKTVAQVARLLEESRVCRAGDFVRAAARKPESYGLDLPVSRRSVEGYLMPDTYRFPAQAPAREIVRTMLRNWETKVLQPHRREFAASDLPLPKIVTIASLIEREARIPRDRPRIASVIRNRLRRRMPLQVDATVLYALGRHKSRVTHADLKVESEYNTYRSAGLPPGPICSPGLDAIRAALNPERTGFLYYVARPDGSHLFSRTFAEHREAIARVREMREPGAAASSG